MTGWTEQEDVIAKKLFDEGEPFSVIGAAVGRTRNSTISRAHRLGWQRASSKHPNARRARTGAKRPKARAPRLVGDHQLERLPQVPVEVLFIEPPAPADFEKTKCTVLELTADVCHWPIGDPGTPGFFFCGGNIAGANHESYCAYHARLGTVAPSTTPYKRRAPHARQAGRLNAAERFQGVHEV